MGTNDDEIDWKEVVVAYYTRIWLEVLKMTTKASVRISGVPADIRTELLPNNKTNAI
jgi:hypothetical protein